MSISTKNDPLPGKSPIRRIWDSWIKFNHVLGNLVAKFWLTVLYFTILVPFGIWTRLSVDPLDLRSKPAATYWHSHSNSPSKTISSDRE